jgi:hypothetical protein
MEEKTMQRGHLRTMKDDETTTPLGLKAEIIFDIKTSTKTTRLASSLFFLIFIRETPLKDDSISNVSGGEDAREEEVTRDATCGRQKVGLPPVAHSSMALCPPIRGHLAPA